MNDRELLCTELNRLSNEMIENCVRLVQIPSETPPSDTRQAAACAVELLKQIPGMEIKQYMREEPVQNVIAVLKSGKPGKRLVFNGHLDTYSVGIIDSWDESPWSGIIKDNHIYGRGSADMKGGIACFLAAIKVLSQHKDIWSGEIVVTLAGDEEAMGSRGTKFLLEEVPEAAGDAMICADVGAPDSLRFGQKGLIWITLEAAGRSAHGAHLHKGENAVLKLIKVISDLQEQISDIPVEIPPVVADAIAKGAAISEAYAGPGETEILKKITVNYGTFSGGSSPNLVPEYAKTEADIRIPAGVTTDQIIAVINSVVARYKGVSYTIDRAYEANWSNPGDELFAIVKNNSEAVLNREVVVTFRIGASDSRLYRLLKNIPTINCGLTPFGLGRPNEHVSIAEMKQISQIHLLSALDYLQSK